MPRKFTERWVVWGTLLVVATCWIASAAPAKGPTPQCLKSCSSQLQLAKQACLDAFDAAQARLEEREEACGALKVEADAEACYAEVDAERRAERKTYRSCKADGLQAFQRCRKDCAVEELPPR